MRVSKLIAATTALSMAAAPVAAAPANPAAKLSLASDSAGAAAQAENEGTPSGSWLIAGLVVVAVIVAALALGGDHDSSSASS